MSAPRRNAPAIPAALRPRATPVTPPITESDPPLEIHIAWLVPHIKVLELFRDKVAVVGPVGKNIVVHAHAILDDKKHPAASLAPEMRMALVQSGLVEPDQVAYTYPVEVSLGWPAEEQP